MELNQIKGSFAGEIAGLDIAKPISPATVDAIEAAMAEHAVVVVRAQEPRDEDLIRFSRCFGGLELPRSGGYFDGSHKRIARELFDAGNLNVDGDIQAEDDPARRFGKGNALWHTDSSFNALPTKWSLLMGYVIPPEGGQTHFVDTRQAYEQLDDAMKARIQDYRVVHSL